MLAELGRTRQRARLALRPWFRLLRTTRQSAQVAEERLPVQVRGSVADPIARRPTGARCYQRGTGKAHGVAARESRGPRFIEGEFSNYPGLAVRLNKSHNYAVPASAGPKAFASFNSGTWLLRLVAPPLDFDAQTLDFLIERGERNLEALGGFGLAPVGLREHIENDAPLVGFSNFEE